MVEKNIGLWQTQSIQNKDKLEDKYVRFQRF